MIGESGIGKSYLVQFMYEYVIVQVFLLLDVLFISFNCVQYVSNFELLVVNFFGYVKGVFIGVQSDRLGVFEVVDGGMLFLDEVYWLSVEGQEKFFIWFDCGEIYWVGDIVQGYLVLVCLVFVMIEEIYSIFLMIFL